jgi:ferredoxin/flavodoxin---NADP+ reductase
VVLPDTFSHHTAVPMTETPSEVDLLIVGAGPTGLYAAYYAGFRELSTAIVDSLPEAGGQVTAMYPEKQIFDVAGFPSIIGRDLVAQLVEQTDQFKPTYLLGQRARTVTALDEGFEVGLDGGASIRAGAILITAGMGEFTPRPLPAGDGWLGRGMVHFVPALEEHRDQDVVVVGGGDSAFDWALSLHPIARSVTIVHRRNKFRAFAATVRQVRELGVPIITDAQVVALRGSSGGLAEVELAVASDPSPVVLPAQTVVAALGFTADLGPIESWGLEITRRAVAVDTTMKTARDRIYAAGDIAAYPGKVKLIATGFGEAATAVNNIAVVLNPEAHLFPGHSSDVS